jgi:hypothetical protein
MAHGYSLRPNSKGRRRHQNTDETKEQVEGTSTSSTSTSTTSTREERHQTLTDKPEGEVGTVDPRPATLDMPRARAPHNPPWTWHSRNIAISAPTTSRHHIEGPPEAIQAARKREEARHTAEAVRIRREQIVLGYEEEPRALHAQILALRCECKLKVERARWKAERKWAAERGEVEVVVEDDGDGEEGNLVGEDTESDREDADDGEMAVDKHPAQTQTTSMTTNHDDDKQQWQWSSRSSQFTRGWSHCSESNFPPPPPPLRKSQEQQHLSQRRQQDVDEMGPGRFTLSPTLADDSCGRTTQVRVRHLLLFGLGLITLSRCGASEYN